MIEGRFITSDLSVEGPVTALRTVSHDPTLREQVTMNDGRRLTALQLQGEYLELARKYVDDRLGSDADPQTVDVLDRWESVLTRLAQDPMLCARELDWVAKLKLLNSYRDRDGLDWDDAKLQLIDYQYSDIRPDKGLYQRLVQLGRIDRLLTDEAASWDSVIFDLPGRESLQRVPTIDPLRGSKAHVAELIDRCATAEELFRALTR
jgi:proteasome accessory factor A